MSKPVTMERRVERRAKERQRRAEAMADKLADKLLADLRAGRLDDIDRDEIERAAAEVIAPAVDRPLYRALVAWTFRYVVFGAVVDAMREKGLQFKNPQAGLPPGEK